MNKLIYILIASLLKSTPPENFRHILDKIVLNNLTAYFPESEWQYSENKISQEGKKQNLREVL